MNTQKFDKKGYIVLQKDEEYLIAQEKWFEDVPVSETYDNYGQKIDKGTAGDYLTLNTQVAVDAANDFEEKEETGKTWEIETTVNAYENWEVYEILKELDEEDVTLYKETCKAYTFWNGSNWQTIVIESENGYTDCNRVDEDLENEILEEFFEMEYERGGGGERVYKSDKYNFVVSQFANAWEEATAVIAD